MKEQGLFIVHTGNGKGKTTAAFGLALRAFGQKQRVCILQFIKGKWPTGEARAIECMGEGIELHTLGTGFSWDAKDFSEVEAAAKEAWRIACEKIAGDLYDMIVLDELTHLVNLKILSEEEIVHTLNNRPKRLHVVVTGRNAGEFMIKHADLVTEMVETKHPFRKGWKARKGIEY